MSGSGKGDAFRGAFPRIPSICGLSLLFDTVILSITDCNGGTKGEKSNDSEDNGHPGPWLTSRLPLSGNHKKCVEPFRAGEDKQYLYGPSGPGSSQQKQPWECEPKGHQGVDSFPKKMRGDHDPAYDC